MPQLIVLIVDDVSKVDDVLSAWIECGVTGASSLDTYGIHELLPGELREDLPLIPSLADLMHHNREEPNRLIFSVIRDDFDLEHLVAVTEAILGKMADPHTGICFTVPIGRVWGLQPPRPAA